jgi:hypothetical protein
MGHDVLGILVVNGAIAALVWVLGRFKPLPPKRYFLEVYLLGVYLVLAPAGFAAWSGGPNDWLSAGFVCIGVVLLHFGWPTREAAAAGETSHPVREAPAAR